MNKSGKKDRCNLGKSCGVACIQRVKLCLIELGGNVRKNLRKFRDRVAGSLGLKSQANNEFVYGDRRKLDSYFGQRIKKAREAGRNEEVGRLKKEREMAKSRLENVRNFLKNLKSSLPEGSELTSSKNTLGIGYVTKSGDKVDVSFSPKGGFHFRVNGQLSAGSVTTEEGKKQVSRIVKEIFKAVIASLPEGATIKTKAHMDEDGMKRVAIYKRLGFSNPVPPKGWQFAVKLPSGKMSPTSQENYEDFSKNSGNLFFSEVEG